MKSKTIFLCSDCGYESAKWFGKCPGCGNWNTMSEYTPPSAVPSKAKTGISSDNKADTLNSIDMQDAERFSTGEEEFDRVLGGGVVRGSLVLVGGDPGIGKSTILLQICEHIGKSRKILYVSGEESKTQIKMRASRLNVKTDNLYILADTDMGNIMENINKLSPEVVIIDSVQTMRSDGVNSPSGSVSQVREATITLMNVAKSSDITVFVIGHVTKDGSIAGPKVLEHMVDCVLYFEGESNIHYRILRAVKNRFGSVNEIGVFRMTSLGLEGVENPSAALLEGRPQDVSGMSVVCSIEGTRGVMAEIQALVTPTGFGNPRRMSSGVDYNRMVLLLAVLEKRAHLSLYNQDVYLNVAGGLRLIEPCVDLGICAAVASGCMDFAIPPYILFVGEVGLAGEVRNGTQIQKRIDEAQKLGFTAAFVPYSSEKDIKVNDDFTLYPVKSVAQMVFLLKKICTVKTDEE